MVSEQDRRAIQLKSKMSVGFTDAPRWFSSTTILQDIDQRRSQLANQYGRAKPDEHPTEATSLAKSPHTDLLVKQHEDQLKHFQVYPLDWSSIVLYFVLLQKMLDKNEEVEHNLRQSVKEAEYQRRKKEQEVQRLKDELIRKKRDDAKKIHDAIARAEQEEKSLERHLFKEKSKLDEVRWARGRDVEPIAVILGANATRERLFSYHTPTGVPTWKQSVITNPRTRTWTSLACSNSITILAVTQYDLNATIRLGPACAFLSFQKRGNTRPMLAFFSFINTAVNTIFGDQRTGKASFVQHIELNREGPWL